MSTQQIEYGVVVSEKSLLDHRLDELRNSDPERHWSSSTIDQILDCCCCILEETGGSLSAVWHAGLADRWTKWVQRFEREQIPIAEQILDRESTILVPTGGLSGNERVIRNGVTWRVVEVREFIYLLRRHGRDLIQTIQPGQDVQVVVRSNRRS